MNEEAWRPETRDEVVETLREASSAGRRVHIRGAGTRSLTLPSRPVIHTSGLCRRLDLDAEESILSTDSGITLDAVIPRLADAGLVLGPLAVPELIPVLARGTIGGLFSDPRETPLFPRWGRTRDAALGVEAVRGDGTAFKAGGRVVKNVTGYDLTRFLCGSRGRYALITRVHWRVLPRPEATPTIEVRHSSWTDLWQGLDALRREPLEPIALAVLPGPGPEARVVEGGRSGVAEARLARTAEVLGGEARPLAEGAPLPGFEPDRCGPLLRIHLPYSRWRELESAELVRLRWLGLYPFAHFGLASLESEVTPNATAEVAAWARSHGGHASWEWLTPETGPSLGLDPERPRRERALADALRREWDPGHVLGGEDS